MLQMLPSMWLWLHLVNFLPPSSSLSPTKGLTIKVTGIRPGNGKVLVAVLTKGEYPSAGNIIPKYYQLLDGTATEQTAVFENVPFGEYALGCYQDTNANLLLDKNTLGIPVEAFAFSNNPSAKWKKPAYEQSLIKYNDAHPAYHVVIKMWIQYWRE